MGYSIYYKGTRKRIHPGANIPTFKTRVDAKRYLVENFSSFPLKTQRRIFGKVEIKKTKRRRRTTYPTPFGRFPSI